MIGVAISLACLLVYLVIEHRDRLRRVLARVLDALSAAGIAVSLLCICWRDRLVDPPPVPGDVDERIRKNVMAAVTAQSLELRASSFQPPTPPIYKATSRDCWLAAQVERHGRGLLFAECTDGGYAHILPAAEWPRA